MDAFLIFCGVALLIVAVGIAAGFWMVCKAIAAVLVALIPTSFLIEEEDGEGGDPEEDEVEPEPLPPSKRTANSDRAIVN